LVHFDLLHSLIKRSSSATLFLAAAIFSAVVINKKGVLHGTLPEQCPI